jgi:hypothetical protein
MHPYPRPFYIKLQEPHLPEDVYTLLNSLVSSVKSLQLLCFWADSIIAFDPLHNSVRTLPEARR